MEDPTRALLRLAAAFLDEYSDRLGNDGCNDWEWPDNVPRALRKAMEEVDQRLNPSGWEPWGKEAPPNHVAVSVVAEMLQRMADES